MQCSRELLVTERKNSAHCLQHGTRPKILANRRRWTINRRGGKNLSKPPPLRLVGEGPVSASNNEIDEFVAGYSREKLPCDLASFANRKKRLSRIRPRDPYSSFSSEQNRTGAFSENSTRFSSVYLELALVFRHPPTGKRIRQKPIGLLGPNHETMLKRRLHLKKLARKMDRA